jgi:hypothetical protein
MKKKLRSANAVPPPAAGASAPPQGEGGAGQSPRSTIKLLRPDQVWQPRIGAPLENQNALKPINAINRQVRDLKRRIRAAPRNIP